VSLTRRRFFKSIAVLLASLFLPKLTELPAETTIRGGKEIRIPLNYDWKHMDTHIIIHRTPLLGSLLKRPANTGHYEDTVTILKYWDGDNWVKFK
jgi:hypothetical protein